MSRTGSRRPLTSNLTLSGRSAPAEYQTLTPRTPHSRAGDGFTDIELPPSQEEDGDSAQSDPLLPTSSNSNPTSRRIYVDDKFRVDKHLVAAFRDWKRDLSVGTVLSRIPIVVGGFLAAFMIFLVVVSYNKPTLLNKYLGSHPGGMIFYEAEGFHEFPLHPEEFVLQCDKMQQTMFFPVGGYWGPPRNGIVLDTYHPDEDIMENLPENERICESSITYMLGGTAGLMADLALMAQMAALAREKNRTFLVDDTYWDGKWTDYFQDVRELQPGPEPTCKAPPPEELVACPRLARHWVVNARTARYHLSGSFMSHYENPYGHNLNRAKPIYVAAYRSLTHTIRPNTYMSDLIKAARTELVTKFGAPSPSYIGVHIRRGDKKSKFAYRGSYVPIANFISNVNLIWKRASGRPASPNVYVASDSPAALQEFGTLFEHKTVLSLPDSANRDLRPLASPEEYVQLEWARFKPEAKAKARRGMIVDFALLSGAWAEDGDVRPEAVICTISSAVCKMAAVALGWEEAFGHVDDMGKTEPAVMKWIDIDQGGVIMPVWEAFDLFR
ncbi:hypothetical protein C8J56DRAFT_327382 [Mycena floridula]|nr:hypothetical protein C8J56DRAFT_327382 [Mycena floridula]